MFQDATLTFNSAFGTPTAISATGTSSVIDLTGAGVGNAPRMIGGFPATNNTIGFDIGYGDGEAIPYLVIEVSTAGTGAGTITFFLESAPDNGSYSPGTYTVLWSSAALVGTSLTIPTLLEIPVPPAPVGTALPRFYKLGWTVGSTATVSILAGLTLNPPSSLMSGQYPNNFVAA